MCAAHTRPKACRSRVTHCTLHGGEDVPRVRVERLRSRLGRRLASDDGASSVEGELDVLPEQLTEPGLRFSPRAVEGDRKLAVRPRDRGAGKGLGGAEHGGVGLALELEMRA